jgi:hypothetical protein
LFPCYICKKYAPNTTVKVVTINAHENFCGNNILRPKNIMETFGNKWKQKICIFVLVERPTKLEEGFRNIKKSVPTV